MRRRTLEEKLEAIRLVEAGNSPRSVSDRLHIGHHQIYEWLYIYKEKGVSGLENKRICKKNQYSFEKKCEIIREYQESELTLPEISSKHGIASSTLVGWLSKFNKGGKDALAIKQPSPREQSKSIMKRLPKEECEKENESEVNHLYTNKKWHAKQERIQIAESITPTSHLMNSSPTRSSNIFKTETNQGSVT